MWINESTEIIKHKNGGFTLRVDGEKVQPIAFNIPSEEELEKAYNEMVGKDFDDKAMIFENFCGVWDAAANTPVLDEEAVPTETPEEIIAHRVREALGNLISFFTEFNFTPSFRFVNSLAHSLSSSVDDGRTYITNYFKLIDSPYAGEVEKKMRSAEFTQILRHLSEAERTKNINSRFRIYYGSQGTGKTTMAMSETGNLCMVCNSSMLPADLMEDFTFDDGKATFHPSILARCMEEGRPIVMDEINLLPFDSLRFLQGVFDGKTEFQYKGQTVHIKEGFKVIGTMNLTVNGVTFGLPEPLIDRCEMIKEFKLDPAMLMNAF